LLSYLLIVVFRWAIKRFSYSDSRAIAVRRLQRVRHEKMNGRGAMALAPPKHLKLLGTAPWRSFIDNKTNESVLNLRSRRLEALQIREHVPSFPCYVLHDLSRACPLRVLACCQPEIEIHNY
jgi:hypothetical protein